MSTHIIHTTLVTSMVLFSNSVKTQKINKINQIYNLKKERFDLLF